MCYLFCIQCTIHFQLLIMCKLIFLELDVIVINIRCIMRISRIITKISYKLQVDPMNSWSLECVIRRVFKSSQGHDCMVLCPVDMWAKIILLLNMLYCNPLSWYNWELYLILLWWVYLQYCIELHNSFSTGRWIASSGMCLY